MVWPWSMALREHHYLPLGSVVGNSEQSVHRSCIHLKMPAGWISEISCTSQLISLSS